MATEPTSESGAVLERGLLSLSTGAAAPLVGPTTAAWSERCVEVPWIAAHLAHSRRLLDVGWSMSPPEWLEVLLALESRGTSITGIDIVDPLRVQTRYPTHLVERVLAVPVRIESILEAEPLDGGFDTVTCVSTLEHIGFDIASPPDVTGTAFLRARTAEEAARFREPDTDERFLKAVARLLEPGGALLLSVPAGKGQPILHQDSLGLFTYQLEYGEQAWRAITESSYFTLEDQAFFRHESANGWFQVAGFDDLTDQTSELRPFATGCAMARLVRSDHHTGRQEVS